MTPFNTGDCLIEVITWVGLTVYALIKSSLRSTIFKYCYNFRDTKFTRMLNHMRYIQV